MIDAFGVERTDISKGAPNIPRYLKGLKSGRILPQTGKVRSLAEKTFGRKRVNIFNNNAAGPPGKKGKTIALYTQGEDNALGTHPFSHGYHKVGQNGKILSNKENPKSLSEYYSMENKTPLHGSALSLFSRRTKGVINVQNKDRPVQQIAREPFDSGPQRASSVVVIKERKLRQVPAVQAAAGTAAVGGAGIVYNKKKKTDISKGAPSYLRHAVTYSPNGIKFSRLGNKFNFDPMVHSDDVYLSNRGLALQDGRTGSAGREGIKRRTKYRNKSRLAYEITKPAPKIRPLRNI